LYQGSSGIPHENGFLTFAVKRACSGANACAIDQQCNCSQAWGLHSADDVRFKIFVPRILRLCDFFAIVLFSLFLDSNPPIFRDLLSVQASGGYSYAFACEVAEALSVLPRSAQVRFLLSAAHALQYPVRLHDYPGPHGVECMVMHAAMDYGSCICGPGSVCVRAWPID
jgi:hypothetical protein